jgi:hypothetical protein
MIKMLACGEILIQLRIIPHNLVLIYGTRMCFAKFWPFYLRHQQIWLASRICTMKDEHRKYTDILFFVFDLDLLFFFYFNNNKILFKRLLFDKSYYDFNYFLTIIGFSIYKAYYISEQKTKRLDVYSLFVREYLQIYRGNEIIQKSSFMIFHFKSSFLVGIMKCNNFHLKTFNLFSFK